MLILAALGTRAQLPVNLVPNGSFEDYWQCPSVETEFDIYVKYWYNPTSNSPNYLHPCAGSELGTVPGVPWNYTGYQFARTGDAYAGLIAFADYFDTFNLLTQNLREYIGSPLTVPLETDSLYCVEFYVSLANGTSRCATSNIGA